MQGVYGASQRMWAIQWTLQHNTAPTAMLDRRFSFPLVSSSTQVSGRVLSVATAAAGRVGAWVADEVRKSGVLDKSLGSSTTARVTRDVACSSVIAFSKPQGPCAHRTVHARHTFQPRCCVVVAVAVLLFCCFVVVSLEFVAGFVCVVFRLTASHARVT